MRSIISDSLPIMNLLAALLSGDPVANAELVKDRRYAWLCHGMKDPATPASHKSEGKRLEADERLLCLLREFVENYGTTPNYQSFHQVVSQSPLAEGALMILEMIPELPPASDNLPHLLATALADRRAMSTSAIYSRAALLSMSHGPTKAQAWIAKMLAWDYTEDEHIDDRGDKVAYSSRVLGGEDKDTLVEKKIYTQSMDSVVEKERRWLWDDKIPLGKITWFVGRPQNGKSMTAIDVIARVTTGRDFPDGTKNTVGPAKVYAAFSEDEVADTIRPRLRAAEADTSKIETFTRASEDGCNRAIDLASDIAEIEKMLLADPAYKLIVFDPLPSFLADVNLNQTNEARPVMDSLMKLCERTGVALLGIIHENKRTDVTAIHKIPGDASVAGVARMAWSFSRDTEDKEKFRMSLIKGNITKKRSGLGFTIGQGS
jgi:AAA domain